MVINLKTLDPCKLRASFIPVFFGQLWTQIFADNLAEIIRNKLSLYAFRQGCLRGRLEEKL
ncbi:MAG: hypothetical protein WA902_04895, partial [Thermosynechococcaceae cyanobacterium]